MPGKKKKAAKKAISPKKTVPVFSRAFLKMLHEADFQPATRFQVSCNVEGNLPGGTFSTIDEANDFAAGHRRTHPGHKLTVSATQTS